MAKKQNQSKPLSKLPDQQAAQQQQSTESPSLLEELNDIDQAVHAEEMSMDDMEITADALNVVAAEDDESGLDEAELNERAEDDFATDDAPSYGTGVQGEPVDRHGRRAHLSRGRYMNQADAELTGGDIDANYEQANAVGDEAVGGTVATPDQDVVDDLGRAVGIEVDDRSFLRTIDTLSERDDRRWELDPKSSEGYDDRREP
jgi:hypothetical protein